MKTLPKIQQEGLEDIIEAGKTDPLYRRLAKRFLREYIDSGYDVSAYYKAMGYKEDK